MKFIKGKLYRYKKNVTDLNSLDWLNYNYEYVGHMLEFKTTTDMIINTGLRSRVYGKGEVLRLSTEDMELVKDPKSHLPTWW